MKLKDPNITAEVLLDSICNGHRLTTMKVRCPRIILSEFNTHRAFSRNSASSRAIPTSKFRNRVKENPYFPQQWNVAGVGMTAAGPMNEFSAIRMREELKDLIDNALDWHSGCEAAFAPAKEQINRYLEPFMYTEILVSATEWLNFFYLRCSPQADPAMQMTADAMLEAYIESFPKLLKPGEWHFPFFMKHDKKLSTSDKAKVCTARCARVTYFNFGEDGKSPDHSKDIATHDKLLNSLHMSPFEHCAQAMERTARGSEFLWATYNRDEGVKIFQNARCGNFTGWAQYRSKFNSKMDKELNSLSRNGGLQTLNENRKASA